MSNREEMKVVIPFHLRGGGVVVLLTCLADVLQKLLRFVALVEVDTNMKRISVENYYTYATCHLVKAASVWGMKREVT